MNKTTNEPYTVPQLCAPEKSEWFIFFRYYHAGKWHLRKYREGINRIKNLKERKKEAEALREVRTDWLKKGWNPIIDPEFKARKIAQTNDVQQMCFCEAMDFAFEKKRPDLAKKSIQDYRNVLNIVKTKAIETGLSFVNVKQVTRLHILDLLAKLFEDRKMSNHRYNVFLGVVRSLFSTLEVWTICEYNPASKIQKKEVAESNFYATFTEEEKIRISEYLSKKHYQLFVFMQVVYHTGIRPKELLALRVGSVDLKRRVIIIVPDLKEETSKTNFIRPVPIPNALFPFFKEMYLDQYPNEFFLFGSPFEPGKGNRGAGSVKHPWGQRRGHNHTCGIMGAMRPDYLTPSPYNASRDTVGRLWKNLIKEPETGLGIDKCLYAAKHTGADDKILAGIDLDALRNLYGHRSKQMTERYAKQIKEVYNSSIRTQATAFTGGKVRKIA